MTDHATVFSAIQGNNEAGAIAALNAMASLDAFDPSPSPVLQALHRGMERLPAELVRRGYQLSLLEAAALGDAAAVSIRLAAGEPTDTFCPDGWTALHLAAFRGRDRTVTALLLAGASHEAVSQNAMANQPLQAAIAGRCDAETIATLLKAGANVSYIAGAGWTALHLAAARGNGHLCETLIAKGADRHARSHSGQTPADTAIARGHPALVPLFD